MISTRSKTTIDACRYCWMCRHICPIGNVTDRSATTPVAVPLRWQWWNGAAALSDVIDNVYECALCGACTKECVTGWDPVAFTREVRLEAALSGITPAYIDKMLQNIEIKGNPYGQTGFPRSLNWKLKKPQKLRISWLFLGQDARYKVPHAAINAIRLLKQAGVDFTVLPEEPDSGYALETLIGAAEETRQMMNKAANVLSAYETVVAFDPADAKVFLREYKEWDIPLNTEVKTFTAFGGAVTSKTAAPQTESDHRVSGSRASGRDLRKPKRRESFWTHAPTSAKCCCSAKIHGRATC